MQIPNLRELRELHGLTQKEIADVSGVSLRSVAGYEGGAHVRPNTARKLAQALNVEVADLVSADSYPKAQAPPSSIQPPLNGFGEEERRSSLTTADFNAAETLADVCERLEQFLDIAEGGPVGAALLAMQHYLIRVAVGLSLPLMEKEAFRALVQPTGARFIELTRRFEELRESEAVTEKQRESEAVTEEEVAQNRELVKELTRRISEAA